MPAPHTILVAEDDPAARLLWTRYLRSKKYQVLAAADGAEALELQRTNAVDLVVTDIDMPRLNGISLLRQLRQSAPALPVIMITGKPEVAAAVECMRIGALDYISKPFHLKDLSAKIAAALEPPPPVLERTTVMPPARYVGPYRLLRLLGEGGTGMVFLADRRGCQFALKVLREDLLERSAQGGRWLARFQREAAVATSLRHDHLVPVLDYGTASDTSVPYMVMPYIQGCSLDAFDRTFPQTSLRTKVRLFMEVAEGLEAVHAAGICHRDIKPQNILVRAHDLHALLTDFGIARVPGSDLSMAGELLGTPNYMAPESFDSAAVDLRADLFSLGAVGYGLLTGRKPFQADTVAALALQIAVGKPVAPAQLVPEFPAPMASILAVLLQKNPLHRYPDVTALLADLRAFLADQELPRSGEQLHAQASANCWS